MHMEYVQQDEKKHVWKPGMKTLLWENGCTIPPTWTGISEQVEELKTTWTLIIVSGIHAVLGANLDSPVKGCKKVARRGFELSHIKPQCGHVSHDLLNA